MINAYLKAGIQNRMIKEGHISCIDSCWAYISSALKDIYKKSYVINN